MKESESGPVCDIGSEVGYAVAMFLFRDKNGKEHYVCSKCFDTALARRWTFIR